VTHFTIHKTYTSPATSAAETTYPESGASPRRP
jgi:hypothetical protein